MNDSSSTCFELAILAKAPLPGLCKTRLIPRLGAAGAAALQGWLLERAVATAVTADIGPVSLWCAPDESHPAFRHCRAFGDVRLLPQSHGDLGARMHAAVAASRMPGGTLIIGTDCPVLTPRLIRQVAAALGRHDAVIVPAEDGGYVLIALRRAHPRLFADIDWSTDRVMAQTRERLSELGLDWNETAPLWDVDRPEDFDRLAEHIPTVRSVLVVAEQGGNSSCFRAP
ncbi:MAG TPA: hypothetical protein DCL01_06505 [Thauera sp.]|nr:hypothetical protein [Thauera sp.]HHW65028.1 glycosyltransferase [Rhodocyclaceae bacterium]